MNRHAAFIGAGLIGAGLALNCVTHGVPAVLQTRAEDMESCKARMASGFDFFERHGIITPEERAKAEKLAVYTTSVEEAVSGAGFIQESVPDSLEIKHQIIARIEAVAPADAIIATATSSLSVSRVFEKAQRPERCMGGHPYNPSYLIPLVEVTRTANTAGSFVARAKEFYTRIGKEPVVLNREVVGYIANRYQSAIHREAVDLVENGVCSVEDADKALMYSVGLRWSVVGQYLSMHLGVAPEGIGSFNEKFHIDVTRPDGRLSSMPSWTTFPADWCEKAAAGLEEAIAHRSPEMGRDIPSIEQWRDRMLVETLRLHGKL